MPDSPLPDPQRFPAVMERTIQLVGQRVSRAQLQEVAKVVHTLCWEFTDCGVKSYCLVSEGGGVQSVARWSGAVDILVTTDTRTFHDAAFGRTSFGTALLMGRLRVKGVSALEMGKLAPLVDPFLESYKQACGELSGHAP